MTDFGPTVVIIGAGFSGTALAVNLLRLPHRGGLRIVLVDRDGHARGTAYARREHPYRLNVPAGRMSASSADPTDFLAFARRRLPHATAEDFLPRELYGEYLEATLRGAALLAASDVRLDCVEGEAVRIEGETGGSPLCVRLADGRSLAADDVVLALGNPPPARLPSTAALRRSTRCIENPWEAPLSFAAAESVLLVGTSLTMADVVTAASDATRDDIVIHAISRRGLTPPAQTAFRSAPESGAASSVERIRLMQAAGRSARRLMREVRDLCDRTERDAGGDWREAITFVHHLAPELWSRMPPAERRRFLRHARLYWDLHRHRLPNETLETLSRLRRAGKLHVHAGRTVALESHDGRIRATWRPRGEPRLRTLLVDRVINCTGPDYDVYRSQSPIVRSLLADGLACRDPLGLGFSTGRAGALIDTAGCVASNLCYLGPMLRADRWETTAVPELRQHAERLAHHLAARIAAHVPAIRAAI